MASTDQQFPHDLTFYSLADPVHPRFISSYVPTSAAGLAVKPHEIYLCAGSGSGRAVRGCGSPPVSAAG